MYMYLASLRIQKIDCKSMLGCLAARVSASRLEHVILPTWRRASCVQCRGQGSQVPETRQNLALLIKWPKGLEPPVSCVKID